MKRITVAVTLVAAMLLLTCITPLIGFDNGSSSVEGTGDAVSSNTSASNADQIEIYTAADLAKIGNDAAYPLNGDYILMNDINFGTTDTNGSYNINMTLTYNLGQLTISSWGTITVLFDGEVHTSTFTTNINYDSSEEHSLVIFGTYFGVTFAYSITIPPNSTSTSQALNFDYNGNFTPIGTIANPFTGTFDGNGYSIIGLTTATYTTGSVAYGGLFGHVSNATIENLNLVDAEVTVAVQYSGTTGSEAYVGGMIGLASGSVTISNVTVDSKTTLAVYSTSTSATANSTASVGGIIGQMNAGTITDSESTGSIIALLNTTSGSYASDIRNMNIGGVVGLVKGETRVSGTKNSSSMKVRTAAVSGTAESKYKISIGGIIGNSEANISITGSSNTGNISSISNLSGTRSDGTTYIAGILGQFSGTGTVTIMESENEGNISDILRGGVTSQVYSVMAGGVVNSSASGSTVIVYSSANTGNISLSNQGTNAYRTMVAGGIVGIAYNSVLQDSYNYGNITANAGLQASAPNATPFSVLAGGIVGYSTVLSATYVQNEGDVTVTSYGNITNAGNSFVYTSSAGGIGNGGIINISFSSNSGVISVTDQHNISGTAKVNTSSAGLIGNSGSTISIDRSYNEGDIELVSNVTISNATVESITSSGGLVGISYGNAAVTDSYNIGDIRISVSSQHLVINITENISAGGIIGAMVASSNLNPSFVIENSYNAGMIESAWNIGMPYLGGLVGYGGTSTFSEIDRSYFLEGTLWFTNTLQSDVLSGTDVLNVDPGYNGPMSSGSRTEDEMKERNTFFSEEENAGWDLNNIWFIEEGYNYPEFRWSYLEDNYFVSFETDIEYAYEITYVEYSPEGPIPAGSEFVFTITLIHDFEGSIYVTASNGEITETDGTYRLSGVDAGTTVIISISGEEQPPDTYYVETPTRDMPYVYSITSDVDFGQLIEYGEDFQFEIELAEGYYGYVVVTASDGIISRDGNEYTLSGVTSENVTISISGAKRIEIEEYSVEFSTDIDAYQITVLDPSGYATGDDILTGTEFGFTVDILEGYAGIVNITIEGATFVIENGVYILDAISSGTVSIQISGASEAPEGYRVILITDDSDAYTISSDPFGFGDDVGYGEAFTFTVMINEGYTGTVIVEVYNGTLIDNGNGTYTLYGTVEGAVVIVRVSGVTPIEEGYNVVVLTDDTNAYVIYGLPDAQDVIPYGNDITFAVTVSYGYEGTVIVEVYGAILTANDNGTYTLSEVSAGTIVVVNISGVTRIPDGYTVFVIQDDPNAYVISGLPYEQDVILYGQDIDFSVEMMDGYQGTVNVAAYGASVIYNDDGTYTLSEASAGTTVIVYITGVTRTPNGYTVVVLTDDPDAYVISGLPEGTVDYGKDVVFTVALADGYQGTVGVAAYGATLIGNGNGDGTYTLSEASAGTTVIISIIGASKVPDDYAVVVLTDDPDAYVISGIPDEMLRYDEDFSFSVSLAEGHQGTVSVTVYGASLTDNGDGTYTLSEASAGTTVIIIITGASDIPAGYTVVVLTDDPDAYVTSGILEGIVEYGVDFTFSVALAEGYQGTISVTVYGASVIYNDNGTYTISGASAGAMVIIDITGASEIPAGYTVVVLTDDPDAYVISGLPEGTVSESFTFSVSLAEGYQGTGIIVVYGASVADNDDGTYTLSGASPGAVVVIMVIGAETVSNNVYFVDLPEGLPEGFVIEAVGIYSFGDPIPEGEEFSFIIETASNDYIVVINGMIITSVNGVYTVSGDPMGNGLSIEIIETRTPIVIDGGDNGSYAFLLVALAVIIALVLLYAYNRRNSA